jgi:hypothetical protein
VNDATAAALHAEARGYEQARLAGRAPEPEPLFTAARAHLAVSRPPEEILAEYSPLLDSHSAGEAVDLARLQGLMGELGPVRKAAAIVSGALPGGGPVVTPGAAVDVFADTTEEAT